MKIIYRKEDMQPLVDFLNKGFEVMPEGDYRNNLKKIADNFKVAYDSAADNVEKHAYLYALYINNVAALASYLFEYHLMSEEMGKEYYALPSRKDADDAIAPYKEAMQKENDEIKERQDKIREQSRGLEVFKAIALGYSPEEAKEKVQSYEEQMNQAMVGQH